MNHRISQRRRATRLLGRRVGSVFNTLFGSSSSRASHNSKIMNFDPVARTITTARPMAVSHPAKLSAAVIVASDLTGWGQKGAGGGAGRGAGAAVAALLGCMDEHAALLAALYCPSVANAVELIAEVLAHGTDVELYAALARHLSLKLGAYVQHMAVDCFVADPADVDRLLGGHGDRRTLSGTLSPAKKMLGAVGSSFARRIGRSGKFGSRTRPGVFSGKFASLGSGIAKAASKVGSIKVRSMKAINKFSSMKGMVAINKFSSMKVGKLTAKVASTGAGDDASSVGSNPAAEAEGADEGAAIARAVRCLEALLTLHALTGFLSIETARAVSLMTMSVSPAIQRTALRFVKEVQDAGGFRAATSADDERYGFSLGLVVGIQPVPNFRRTFCCV